jgi:hypothetical protein
MTSVKELGSPPVLRDILRRALWAPALVFVVHVALSRLLHAYERLPWLDIVMHLLGGYAIAYCFAGTLDCLQVRGLVAAIDSRLRVVLILALTCTAAVFWEFAEFSSDRVAGTKAQLGLEDTLFDMLLGIVGGVLFVLGSRLARVRCP